jgi:hypothetical protein
MNPLFFRRALLIMTSLSALLLTAADTVPAPPIAKKVPHETEINGHKMVDNYYWLREKSNPEVRAYLEKENAYSDAVMKPTEPLQKKLYDEMLSRVKETDVEVPYKEGDYFYYVRTEAGKQYQIRCRRKASMEAPEEVLLDINQMAQGKPFMTVQAFAVSPDGNLLAYSYDDTGFRQFTLAVKDLRTGQTLGDHAVRVGSVVWANDNQTIFYTQEDDVSKRQYRLYRHTVGSSDPDILVYGGLQNAEPVLYFPGVAKPHDVRGALHSRHAAGRQLADSGAAQAGRRILSRPQRQLVLYSRERYGTQLPAGERSGDRSRQQEVA